MKKVLLIVLLKILSASTAFSLNPLWAWQHSLNAKITDIAYHNNSLYTCGTFSAGPFIFGNANIANQGGNDVVIMKWDTSGNLIWATSIWGTADETAVSIKVNASGELIIAGHSNSATIDVAGNALTSNGGNDIFIAKYDLNGTYISASIYGTAGSEVSVDMCTDNSNNIYVASNSNITKYDNAGIFVWQRLLLANEIFFSPGDSTIVATGYFTNTLTLGNFSIVAAYSVNWGVQPDVYAAKFSMGNTPLYLQNISNNVRGEYSLRSCLNEQTGKVYVASSRLTLSLDEIMTIREISSMGVISNQSISLASQESMRCKSMSTSDSLLSFRINTFGSAINYIYNTNTFLEIKNFTLSDYVAQTNFFQCIRGVNELYTHSGNNIQFGKISGALLFGSPTYQTLNVCNGNTVNLTGNITGGVGALTYSWLPVNGLNNTNTNSVSFTATNNISYTLTVTDQIGQIAKDTFNINVQNPISPANITSQFPVLCDTMELYANNGVPGNWYYVIGNNWYIPPGQFGGNGLVHKIIQAGRYMYVANNSCGWRYDSIDVAAVMNVSGSVTDDTICAGQSIVFTGSGALNYTWTGGVTDNIPFTPNYAPFTQGFIVTGTDANGCIGKDTVSVKVYQGVTSTLNLSICANQTPYMWNAQSLDSSGTYTANFTGMNGCDSIATLNLTVSTCIVCVPNFTINYSPFYNSLTESQSWIITSGTVLIQAGTQVKLDAHQTSYVMINPGFKADSGAVFVAQAYNGCTAGAPQLPQEGKIANADLFASNEIVLYPNPTSGLIHIKHDEKLTGIQIFDMVGKLVINQKCAGETETNIDLGNLPNGVYHVKAAGYTSIKVIKNN